MSDELRNEIIDAYCFLRKNNQSISDRALDFIKDAALNALSALTTEQASHAEPVRYWNNTRGALPNSDKSVLVCSTLGLVVEAWYDYSVHEWVCFDDKFTLDACEVEVWMEKDTEPQPLKRLSDDDFNSIVKT